MGPRNMWRVCGFGFFWGGWRSLCHLGGTFYGFSLGFEGVMLQHGMVMASQKGTYDFWNHPLS